MSAYITCLLFTINNISDKVTKSNLIECKPLTSMFFYHQFVMYPPLAGYIQFLISLTRKLCQQKPPYDWCNLKLTISKFISNYNKFILEKNNLQPLRNFQTTMIISKVYEY